MTDSSFGARLRTLRKKSGMTQEQLAEAIGVHLNTISRWENNFDYEKMNDFLRDDSAKINKLKGICEKVSFQEDFIKNNEE